MGPIEELLRRMDRNSDDAAIIYKDKAFLYQDLLNLKAAADEALRDKGVAPGDVVALCGDYSPTSMAVLLSLIANRNIVVPISIALDTGGEHYLSISDPDFIVEIDDISVNVRKAQRRSDKNKLITQLAEKSTPGLVLFTSLVTYRKMHDSSLDSRNQYRQVESLLSLFFTLKPTAPLPLSRI